MSTRFHLLSAGIPIVLAACALLLLAARCGDEPAPAREPAPGPPVAAAEPDPEPAPVEKQRVEAGVVVEYDVRAGFGDDFHSSITVRDGRAELVHKTFGFASGGATEPVRYHKQLDAAAASALEELARQTRFDGLPEPVIESKPLDEDPCTVRLTVVLDGARNEATTSCHAKNVLARFAPLIEALEKLRDQIFVENGYQETGL